MTRDTPAAELVQLILDQPQLEALARALAVAHQSLALLEAQAAMTAFVQDASGRDALARLLAQLRTLDGAASPPP